jgi:error-prone DNA polymerase
MGLSKDTVDKLASPKLSSAGYFEEARLRDIGLNPEDPFLKKVLAVTEQYMGFPRQLGQHTGGFIISRHPLSRLCPVLNARMEDRTNIEWNKDDVEALGFLKIDVLALGMLTCIRKCFHLIRDHYGKDYTLATIPQDDPEVYAMIARADTIGVFQIESRAQQSMLPRLKPNCFYDLVIEVAIVRPGPIQGDMVHPYLRRRNGEEPVDYPSEELREILHKTLGVPLFQEQAMKIAIVAAGFTPAEADELRRSMATFKAKGKVSQLEQKLIKGMLAKGYSLDYAQRIFRQLEGFGSYGFPESHAASFAQLVYVSCWIKYHYPDVFACGLLNSQPMGFYQPAQIVIDAQNHGVPVLPVDVNYSDWDCTLEETATGYKALRLGMRQVKGLKEEEWRKMEEAVNIHRRVTPQTKSRSTLRINNIEEVRDLGLTDATLEILADADAFRSIGLDRRAALWVLTKRDHPELLFEGQRPDEPEEKQVELPLMPFPEQVMHDYARTDLSLKAHPMRFLREKLGLLKAVENRKLKELPNGTWVKVSGLVLMRQRPGTAKGVWFITLEDETGIANLVLFPNVVEQYRREMVQARVMMVEGKLQVEGIVIHVLVQKVYNITPMLMTATLIEPLASRLPAAPRTDEVLRGEPEDARVLKAKQHIPASRDFR